MKTLSLDYPLPENLIAQHPIEPRDSSRLLTLDRQTGELEHHLFRDIDDFLEPGDLLVANESRVIPARLFAEKSSGGKVELLLLRQLDELRWRALAGGARTRVGSEIHLKDNTGTPVVSARIEESGERGERVLAFSEPIEAHYDALGTMPLPPYIHETLDDPERYQTVYSRTPGSAAAPTAGLHFTPDLLLQLRSRGINLAFVTLHVGLDTFRPVTEDTLEDHHIHSEWCSLSTGVAEQINRTRVMGKRVIAVGTTSVRVLETAARYGLLQTPDGTCPWRPISPYEGFTELFITPGFHFRVVDALITNFHLPKSTLLALVMAFAGEEHIRQAYAAAVEQRYRFFSFGDAMFIH